MSGARDLASLLVIWRGDLLGFVGRNARGLLRFETEDDLVQGIHLRALSRGESFEYRGEKEFLAWMHTLARGYLVDRRAHWAALKRGSGPLLRLAGGAATTTGGHAAAEPAGTGTSPSGFASRREESALAMKALGAMLPRDGDLVRWHAEGVSLEEQAARLGLTYEAAQRAAHRALGRFRKAFRLLSREE